MPDAQTTPQEIGLELIKVLSLGKQPCKHSDALWEIALNLLKMPWIFEPVITNDPTLPNKKCLICGKDHGGLICPNLKTQ